MTTTFVVTLLFASAVAVLLLLAAAETVDASEQVASRVVRSKRDVAAVDEVESRAPHDDDDDGTGADDDGVAHNSDNTDDDDGDGEDDDGFAGNDDDEDAAEYLITDAGDRLGIAAAFGGFCGVLLSQFPAGNFEDSAFPAGGIETILYVGDAVSIAPPEPVFIAAAPPADGFNGVCLAGDDHLKVYRPGEELYQSGSNNARYVIQFSDVVRAVRIKVSQYSGPGVVKVRTALNGGNIVGATIFNPNAGTDVWTVSSTDGRVFDEIAFNVPFGVVYCIEEVTVPCFDQHLHNDETFYSKYETVTRSIESSSDIAADD